MTISGKSYLARVKMRFPCASYEVKKLDLDYFNE
jgi:hypothetical protein